MGMSWAVREMVISWRHCPLHVSVSVPLSYLSSVCPHAELSMTAALYVGTAALVGAFGVTTAIVDDSNSCSKPFGA